MSTIDHDRMEAEQREKVFQELRTRVFTLECELAEYKQRAEAAEAKLRESEMQEPAGYFSFNDQNNSWRQIDADWAKKEPCSSIQLYAKPFPAPKQEEK